MLQRLGIGIAIVLGTITFLFIALVAIGAILGNSDDEHTLGITLVSTDNECRLGMSGDVYNSLTEEEYERHLRKLACMSEENIQYHLQQFRDPEVRAKEATQQKRWEQRVDHWDKVNAFHQHIERMHEDKVIDTNESIFICGVAQQWVRQLKAAQVYAQEWQRDYHDESGLAKLEELATSGHELASGFLTDCAQYQ